MKLVIVSNYEGSHKIVDAENGNTWVYEPEEENPNTPVSKLIFNHGLMLVDDEANVMWAWLNGHLAA